MEKKKFDLVVLGGVGDLSTQGPEATSSVRRSRQAGEDCFVVFWTKFEEDSDGNSQPVACLAFVVDGTKVFGESFPNRRAAGVVPFNEGTGTLISLRTPEGGREIATHNVVRTNSNPCLTLSPNHPNGPVSYPTPERNFFRSDILVPRILTIPTKPAKRAQDGNGYYLSSETDGRVYEQVFDNALNLLGNQDMVFDHGGTLTSMSGGNVPVPSTTSTQPNSVLVWTKDTGNGKQQVRAHFFHLDPLP